APCRAIRPPPPPSNLLPPAERHDLDSRRRTPPDAWCLGERESDLVCSRWRDPLTNLRDTSAEPLVESKMKDSTIDCYECNRTTPVRSSFEPNLHNRTNHLYQPGASG